MNSEAGDGPPSLPIAADPLPRVARWLLFATLLVPVAVLPGFFFPFVTLRAVYFRVLVELATAILLYLVLRRELVLDVRRDLVFWSLLGWVGANAIAAVFGVAPMRSLFGDHERMGGVWFWLHLLAYYVALRTFLNERQWWTLFRIAVVIAVLVASYGLLQSWLLPFNFGIGGMRAGVTIGNSGLLGAYLLAGVGMSSMLAARSRGSARLIYVASALVLVTGVIFSNNRSSTLGLLLGSPAALMAYILWTRFPRRALVGVVTALLAIVISLPFIARDPVGSRVVSGLPALAKLSRGVDSIRVVQWRAAVDGIRDRPILGFGPENYQIVWSRFYHPEMFRFRADSRWDRAHNAYLDAFATSGIFGFLALLSMCLAMGWATVRSARAKRDGDPAETPRVEAIALGFFVAYAFYLFFWFFDLNSTMLWIAVAAFVASRAAPAPLIAFGAGRGKRWQTTVVLAVGAAAFVAVLYVHGFETLRMARTLDRVRERGRSPAEVLQDYESVFDSPAPMTQHVFTMYAGHIASLRSQFSEIRNDAVSAALFDRAFILAIEEFERQAVRDPHNERVSVQHARVLMLGAYYYDNLRLYESALRRLERAVELAPRRIPTRLSLGMAYLNIQRPREALVEFDTAYALYPPLGQTKAYIGLAYASMQENRQAVAWLKEAVTAGYELDRAILARVATGVADSGEPALGGELLRHYLTSKYGPRSMWRLNSAGDAADYRLAHLASDLFQRGGDAETAQALATAAAELCERAIPLEALGAPVLQLSSSQPPDCSEPWRRTLRY